MKEDNSLPMIVYGFNLPYRSFDLDVDLNIHSDVNPYIEMHLGASLDMYSKEVS